MRIKRSNPAVSEADMTPMIDMVFQLIIFFMLVMNIEQAQADERVKLPADPLAQPRSEVRKSEVVINIGFVRNPDGTTVGDPVVMVQGSDVDVMTYAKTFLPQEAAVAKARGGQEELDRTNVSIRADSEVPTGLIQELIKAGQENGFSRFTMKAKSAEE
jgi:biopolymer transport protein ExbD